MKILTVVSTRPEIIRLSKTIKKLNNALKITHKVVYTNQNYDYNLSQIFFNEFDIKPDYYFEQKSNLFSEQIGFISTELQKVIDIEKPDKILILGDTNGALITAIIAKRNCIPLYHLEAGNRCFNNKVPEEINRKIIDSIADFHLVYTESSRRNLIKEGKELNTIYKVGNPITEIYLDYKEIPFNDILIKKTSNTTVQKKQITKYNYVTLHRSELNKENLEEVLLSLQSIYLQHNIPSIVIEHPRIKGLLQDLENIPEGLIFIEPVNFNLSQNLIKYSEVVLTDSGTLPEECYLHGKQSVLLRECTERPELLENGSMFITGYEYKYIYRAWLNIYNNKIDNKIHSQIDDYYMNTSEIVKNILLSEV